MLYEDEDASGAKSGRALVGFPVGTFREPRTEFRTNRTSPPPIFHPLAYRGVVANWPIEWREQWGRRANSLEEGGLSWRDAETQAFVEVWNQLRNQSAGQPVESTPVDEPPSETDPDQCARRLVVLSDRRRCSCDSARAALCDRSALDRRSADLFERREEVLLECRRLHSRSFAGNPPTQSL